MVGRGVAVPSLELVASCQCASDILLIQGPVGLPWPRASESQTPSHQPLRGKPPCRMRVPPCPVLSSSLEAQALPPPLPTTLPFFVRPHPLQSTAALLEFNHSFLSEHFAVNVQFCARGIVDTLLGRDSSDISPSMDGAAPFFLVEYIWAHGLYLLLGNHSVHYPIQRTQSPTERKLVDVCLIQSFPNFFFFFFWSNPIKLYNRYLGPAALVQVRPFTEVDAEAQGKERLAQDHAAGPAELAREPGLLFSRWRIFSPWLPLSWPRRRQESHSHIPVTVGGVPSLLHSPCPMPPLSIWSPRAVGRQGHCLLLLLLLQVGGSAWD